MALDIALLKTVLGYASYPLKWLATYFKRPELDIEVKFNNSGRSPRGFVDGSQFAADGLCLVDSSELRQAWVLDWTYSLDITNNSEHTATNMLLVKPEHLHMLSIEPSISHTKPLKAGETRSHTLKYSVNFIGTYIEADEKVRRFPFVEMELHYKNFTKLISYYTKYRHEEKLEQRNNHGIVK
jgi:hypothetical protein